MRREQRNRLAASMILRTLPIGSCAQPVGFSSRRSASSETPTLERMQDANRRELLEFRYALKARIAEYRDVDRGARKR
jgi:hypothetical protein